MLREFIFCIDFSWLLGLAFLMIGLSGSNRFFTSSMKGILGFTAAILAVVGLGSLHYLMGISIYFISIVILLVYMIYKLRIKVVYIGLSAILLEILLVNLINNICFLSATMLKLSVDVESFINFATILVALLAYIFDIMSCRKSYTSLYNVQVKTILAFDTVLLWNGVFLFFMDALIIKEEMIKNIWRVSLFCIYLLWGIIIQGYILLKLLKTNQLLKEKEQIQKEYIKAQEEHYADIISRDKRLRRFKHDFVNHIEILDDLLATGKQEEAEKYLEKIKDFKGQINYIIATNNPLVDIVVNKYNEKAKRSGVELKVNGRLPSSINISNYEMSTILFNLLENALEAELKTEFRQIKLELRTNDNMIFIQLENDIAEEPVIHNNFFETSKLDKENHGFGTQNIRETIEKNGGTIEYEVKDSRMVILVSLLNNREAEG